MVHETKQKKIQIGKLKCVIMVLFNNSFHLEIEFSLLFCLKGKQCTDSLITEVKVRCIPKYNPKATAGLNQHLFDTVSFT